MNKWLWIALGIFILNVNVAEGVTLTIRDTVATQGTAGVAVGVVAQDIAGVAGGEIKLAYDASALSAKQVRAGKLLTDASILVVANLDSVGMIQISMAGSTGLSSTTGIILSVIFDVPFESTPENTSIEILGVTLLNEEGLVMPASTNISGQLTIISADPLDIPSQSPVSLSLGDISVMPGDSANVLDVSVHSLVGVAGGTLRLKYNPFVFSDVVIRPSPILDDEGFAFTANTEKKGEVVISFAGSNGLTNNEDVLLQVVFDIPALAHDGVFPIEVEEASFFNATGQRLNILNQTSGIVRVGESETVPVDIGARHITVGSVEVEVGDQAKVIDILVDNATDIAGGKLTIQYDASAIEILNVRGTSLLDDANMTLISNIGQEGIIETVFAGANGIVSGEGVLLQISFDIKPNAQSGRYDFNVSQAVLRNKDGYIFDSDAIVPGIIHIMGAFDGSLPAGPRGSIALDLNEALNDQAVVQSEAPVVGATVVVDVVVTENGQGLNGFNVVLGFDPNQFAYQSFEVKDVFSGAVLIENKDNLSDGRIGLNAAYLGASLTSKRQGTIGQAIFEVLEGYTGLAQISIESAQLAQGGVASAVEVGNGGAYVVIGGGEPAIPTDPVARSDFSGDGQVGFDDFITFASAFGKTSSDPTFDSRIDLNDNGQVDFADFIVFAGLFGQFIDND